MLKDQERTGPNRITRDYLTVAVVRTKLHLAMFFAVAFAATGVITLLQSALDEHLWQAYNAGVACLLAAVICAAVAATLDGQITSTAIITRRIDDLDARFRRAEERMIDQIGGIDRKENRVLHEMTGIVGVLGDELDGRRRKN
jgi:hypothetical protein